jgi:hypothetical protein
VRERETERNNLVRTFLKIAGVVEIILGVVSLFSIVSDIQIIIVIAFIGFGITHLGMAVLLPPRKD